MKEIFHKGKSKSHCVITWTHSTMLSGSDGAYNSKWEQRWGDKMVPTTKPSFPAMRVSTRPNTYRHRLATVCWTWIRWALCPQNGVCARCRGRARRRRTPGASHTTADRRGLWCHPQSVYSHSNTDTQKTTKQNKNGVELVRKCTCWSFYNDKGTMHVAQTFFTPYRIQIIIMPCKVRSLHKKNEQFYPVNRKKTKHFSSLETLTRPNYYAHPFGGLPFLWRWCE